MLVNQPDGIAVLFLHRYVVEKVSLVFGLICLEVETEIIFGTQADDCKLRQHAQQLQARASRYKGERRAFVQRIEHPQVIYEPGKCIDCGLCIQIAAASAEQFGLSFVGRGFDVRVEVPFGRSIAEGLNRCAAQCVAACPTGALATRDERLEEGNHE